MKKRPTPSTVCCRSKGFSLVEVLAAIAIIGIITFLAIPNIVKIKEDGEESLAISRAEALNMATIAFYQKGGSAAANEWAASNNAERYVLVTPYLAFAPLTLDAYQPGEYSMTFPSALPPPSKVLLTKGTGGTEIDY